MKSQEGMERIKMDQDRLGCLRIDEGRSGTVSGAVLLISEYKTIMCSRTKKCWFV